MRRPCSSSWTIAPFLAASIGAATGWIMPPAHGAPTQTGASVDDYIFIDGFDLPVDCSPALTCPSPANGKACISGRLTDAGSGAQLRALFKADHTCNDGAAGGPCDLSVTAHDALDYASNPQASPPLTSVETTLDGCGRFRFASLDLPSSGTVAIVTDDAPASPSGDNYVPSATPHALAANARIDEVNAIATRGETIDAWTQSAGNPFAPNSFADVGVILFAFQAGAVPRPGVTVVRNGNVVAGSDFYFADASSLQRLEIDAALGATGINGAALFADAPGLATYSGTGAEPTGCVWPSVMTTSITGAVVFFELNANCPP